MSPAQPDDPLHGVTLAKILDELVVHFGWERLGEIIPVRCFQFDPSMNSSLHFLRRTPWARAKVESLFVSIQPEPPEIDSEPDCGEIDSGEVVSGEPGRVEPSV